MRFNKKIDENVKTKRQELKLKQQFEQDLLAKNDMLLEIDVKNAFEKQKIDVIFTKLINALDQGVLIINQKRMVEYNQSLIRLFPDLQDNIRFLSKLFSTNTRDNQLFISLYPLTLSHKKNYVEFKLQSNDLRDINGELYVINHDDDIKNIWIFSDVTHIRQYDQALKNQQYQDALTHLGNRTLLIDKMHEWCLEHVSSGLLVGLIFIDIDEFKMINDSYGHHVGDEILKECGKRFIDLALTNAVVARLGGDEFAILINKLNHKEDVLPVFSRIQKLFSDAFLVDGQRFYLSVSIGASFFPSDTREANGLFRLSDIAMYHAKEAGKASYAFYQPGMAKEIKHRIHQFHNVRDILQRRAYRIVFRPVFNVHGQASSMYMTSIDCEELATHHLLKIADMKRLGHDLVLAVVDECIKLKRFLSEQHASFDTTHIAVRLLPSQLSNITLIEQFFTHIQALGSEFPWLTFELPEDVLLYNKNLHVFLESAKAFGIRVHLVDFGRQYSHVGILKEFSSSFQAISISAYFLEQIHESKNQELLQSIVDMCRIFSPQVYMINISNQLQHQACIRAGIDCLEGSFFGAPYFLEDFYQSDALLLSAQVGKH